ncbi:DNA internalization-related competence protein ComEC/Rec2 [Pasteurellaceae bacterium HPA106]|uniref:DNA internalization-related competence protein ComEC/Rec2 n=1 Tax=Spirabiliibacterium pneumoniae TaxID=221400 RepID=UPI001AAD228D|nr:DNA internalization-related competence protein ComEC/Rec2 [Spirabiliibacterium pneumoniae]MBE2895549.1 DNA internalization-related competence protein ComEC/Rec2 [Spirabiliibacterium pneumoniae]
MLRFSLCYLTALLQVLFMPLVALAYYPYLLLSGAGVMLLGWRQRRRVLVTTALLLLCGGAVQCYIVQFWAQANAVARLGTITTQAEIVAINHQSAVYTSVVARLDLRPWQQGNAKFLLNWKIPMPAQVGARWQLTLKPAALKGRLNFGGFSRQRWLIAQGIVATATVKQGQQLAAPTGMRARWLERTENALDGHVYKGLLLALGFGERAEISQAQWQLFRASGTAHLMAISGLHIGLIALFGFILARGVQWLLPMRWVEPHFTLLVSFIFALGYSYLANFSLPTQRALCMLSVWLLVKLLRIHLRWWQVLLYAACVVTLLTPFAYLQEGFWLSFGAVAAIGAFNLWLPLHRVCWRGQRLRALLPGAWWSKIIWGAVSLVQLQLGLLLLFTPVQLLLFGQLAVGALFSNLVLLPIFSLLLMPLLLLNIFTGLLPWAWLDQLFALCVWLLEALPNRLLMLSTHTMWCVSAGAFMLTALLLLALKYAPITTEERGAVPFRHYGKTALLFFMLAVASLLATLQRTPRWQLSMMDVGQGLSLLLESQGKALIYDTGQGWADGSMAKLELIPYLTRAGIQPEVLIISHDDNDHSGGVRDLLAHYPTLSFISPSMKDYGVAAQPCVAGRRWHWQGFALTALLPQQRPLRAHNQDSCVLLVERDGLRFLLTGDLDAKGERMIAHQVGHVDWLQVAHHGSKTSSAWQFLSALQPKVGLIGVGLHNPWRFPHPSVLSRFAKIQSAVYDTALCGQIRISVRNNGWQIACARGRYSPWYHSIVGVAGNNS